MKLSVLSVLFSDRPLYQALHFLKEHGVQAVEIGCGGYPGKEHCDPAALLNDAARFSLFRDNINNSGLELAALSVHGNAVHQTGRLQKFFMMILSTPCCWQKNLALTAL